MEIYTIGFTKKTAAEFFGSLQRAGIKRLIDVRLNNTSQLAGYTKRDDLAFLLREGFAITYEHHPELAPTAEILDTYAEDHDWSSYEACFTALLAERQAETAGHEILGRYHAPCLLCHEATAEHCHRRLVAEWWAAHIPGLNIVHL